MNEYSPSQEPYLLFLEPDSGRMQSQEKLTNTPVQLLQ
jgi:hypothetical protein